MSDVLTCVVCALPIEARVIIDYYRLRRDTQSPWPLYLNDNMVLIVSGVGQSAAANACGYLAGRFLASGNNTLNWLNVGIAGHLQADRGAIFVADKIVEASSHRVFYPALLFDRPLASSEVITYDAPQEQYPDNALCDMEAFAFFSSAVRYSPLELVQVIKVVSDNIQVGVEFIDKTSVVEWVGDGLDLIAAVRDQQFALASEWVAGTGESSVLKYLHQFDMQYRLTHYEKNELRQLLQRYIALEQDESWLAENLTTHKAKKELLRALRIKLDQSEVVFQC